MKPRERVPLAERTTLGVGGAARYYVEAADEAAVMKALSWAGENEVDIEVLGGGSNALIADAGVDALVLRVRDDHRHVEPDGDHVIVDVGAGVCWDELVAWSVANDYAGLECLSGIPGDVGAAPIQNIGAYGQEVSQTIEHVVVIDRDNAQRVVMDAASCQFAYRDSIFKGDANGRYIVVAVRFRLAVGAPPTIAYAELERAVRDHGAATLATTRDTVLVLRRRKSMVIDPEDENRRSAGSFFVNPIVSVDVADAVAASIDEPMPRYPVADDRVKLAAAWLIERAGMKKGTRQGNVGISTRHSLAIVNNGGATAEELVAFATTVRQRVRDRFNVKLHPEPRPLGFDPAEIAALYD